MRSGGYGKRGKTVLKDQTKVETQDDNPGMSYKTFRVVTYIVIEYSKGKKLFLSFSYKFKRLEHIEILPGIMFCGHIE